MLTLTNENIKNAPPWTSKGFRLPEYDRTEMTARTSASPTWVHFGAGNIFKAFPAAACQKLLNEDLSDTGVIAVDRRRKIQERNDNLTVAVTLKSDGCVEKTVIGSVAEHIYLSEDMERLKKIFESPSLQMVSFTITEKGYAPSQSYWGCIAALLRARYQTCRAPLAMVSMDNCSHNGDKLKAVIISFAVSLCDAGFVDWLNDSVSFPWSMIDKITPEPDVSVARLLAADGLDPATPFVNAEECEYLVIEDAFPNGRPPLEKAGIFFTDRETVEKAERMKVCTCLNPLHTSLAVFGCLLGFDRMWKEMQDEDLRKLAKIIGYREGLPVAADPGILSPRDFIDAVVHVRIPNPFLPDTPQRIATDTSQKLPIRFGETIRSYLSSDSLQVSDLTCIPLVFAGWLRYLMAVDDQGNAFAPSPDPLLEIASEYVADFHLGDTPPTAEILQRLEPLLRDDAIFGVDLIEADLAGKVCGYFAQMLTGPGAVRETLHQIVNL